MRAPSPTFRSNLRENLGDEVGRHGRRATDAQHFPGGPCRLVGPTVLAVLFVARATTARPRTTTPLFLVPAVGGAPNSLVPVHYEVLRAACRRMELHLGGRHMGVHRSCSSSSRCPHGDALTRCYTRSWRPCLGVTGGITKVFVVDEPTLIGDIWRVTRRHWCHLVIISYDYLDARLCPAAPGAHPWKGADGVTIEGLLTYPLRVKSAPATRWCFICTEAPKMRSVRWERSI